MTDLAVPDTILGLGDTDARLRVFIGNQPYLPQGFKLRSLVPLAPGELDLLIEENSNHWRKIFNIYAKLCFALHPNQTTSWQEYRKQHLLQAEHRHALIFSPWRKQQAQTDAITLICGKTYATNLGLLAHCDDLGDGFFIDSTERLLVTPYFDYRALSNQRLKRLTDLITRYFNLNP
ncbi:MAG: hypothetical protein P8X74_06905 [Reinekea sp.]